MEEDYFGVTKTKPTKVLKGCGKYFLYNVGSFICGGALVVNGKRKFCKVCSQKIEEEKSNG